MELRTKDVGEMVEELRGGVMGAGNAGVEERLGVLEGFERGMRAFQERFIAGLAEDFNKPRMESLSVELFPVFEEIKLFRRNLRRWVGPRRVKSQWFFPGSRAEVRHEAKGMVLVIAPWNYPLSLALVPLVGALAAGNVVVVKPSELTPRTSGLIAEFVREFLPRELVRVVEGGREVSESLLGCRWDHIFFTGSTAVGKVVARAAAEFLTPVTLELGGKSPVIVDGEFPLEVAATRILWGKLLNGGQTCVAPDYVFVPRGRAGELMAELKRQAAEFQPVPGDGPAIITERHAERLRKLRETCGGEFVVPGGESARVVGLTPVFEPDEGSDLMREEIFGPLLPVVPYDDVDEVMGRIGRGSTPLALYVFSYDGEWVERVLRGTRSGGVTVNDVVLHVGNHHLPFGGSGESGAGNYHGEASFRTFSQERSVFRQGRFKPMQMALNGPYRRWQERMMELLVRWF